MKTYPNPRLTAVSSILAAAIPRLEQGWVKGIQRDRDIETGHTSFCAMGAIASVSRDFDCERRAVKAVEGVSDARFSGLITWNDEPERRKRDVIAAFKRALKHNS